MAGGFNLPFIDVAEELERKVTIILGRPTDVRNLLFQFVRGFNNSPEYGSVEFDGDECSDHVIARAIGSRLNVQGSKWRLRRSSRFPIQGGAFGAVHGPSVQKFKAGMGR
jgi:hypothetical protein